MCRSVFRVAAVAIACVACFCSTIPGCISEEARSVEALVPVLLNADCSAAVAAARELEQARGEEEDCARNAVLAALSSPGGKDEELLLELARIASERWYEESFPVLRQAFHRVWRPRMHILLANAFGRNRDWRMLTGLFDLLADSRAEPALDAAGVAADDPGWAEAHQAYYEAIFAISGGRFETFADLQFWVRTHWEEILRHAGVRAASTRECP